MGIDDNPTIKGKIDLTNEQTIDEAPHWQNEGETIDVADNQDGGKDNTSFWPDEIENPNDLTDLQRSVVYHSVINQQHNSSQIAEKIDKRGGYVRATLKRVCPDWYEDVFKPATNKGSYDGNEVLKNMTTECDKCGCEIILHEPLNGNLKLRCRCTKVPIRAMLPPDWLRDF